MKINRSLIVVASVVTITLGGGLGLVSAATNMTSSNTLVDKIATKFNIKKSDVQAVFDADRADHRVSMTQDRKDKLTQAVKDNNITQAQADHINKALDEIDALRSTEMPGQQDSTTRDQIKTKMDTLRDWATQNKVAHYIMFGGHGGHGWGDRGGPKGPGMATTSMTSQ